RVAAAIGGWLGRLAYRPFRVRAKTVEAQVAFAFPHFTPAQVRATARAAFDNLGRTAIEAAVVSARGRSAVRDYTPIEGIEHLQAAHDAGRGGVIVAGHAGNWELAGAAIAAHGFPCDAIARHMGNPLFERYLTRVREVSGLTIVFDDEAVRRIPRAVKEGRFVGLLADQGVLGLASTFVPFFGRMAKTPRGPAVFALRMNVPVLFAVGVRDEQQRPRLKIEPMDVTVTGDREHDVEVLVAAYTRRLEEHVRQYPGQYFWQHRRWKRQPEGAPPLPPGL
nr:lysophospholipid acyltransferase family protein [Gemmatimonadaceae bacterium]